MKNTEKKTLRRRMKSALHEYPDSLRRKEEAETLSLLQKLDSWEKSRNILVFISMQDEFKTYSIIRQAQKDGKRVWTPRMYGRKMKFQLIDSADRREQVSDPPPFRPEEYPLQYNPYGIWEPLRDLPVFTNDTEGESFVVTPGLAFDRQGNRLGRGRGYYDGWFAEMASALAGGRIHPVAVGYGIQLLDELPHDEHDYPLPRLIVGGEEIVCDG